MLTVEPGRIPTKDLHQYILAAVAPRPIAFASTLSVDGVPNLAPYSFFNAFSSSPPIVGFCSEGRKDSIRNIEETGEFVANLATKSLAEQMNATSAGVPRDVDELALAGLTPAPCRRVAAPRVAEAPAALECKLLQVIRLHDLDGNPLEQYLTLGQVVGVHIDSAYLKDGIFDLAAAHPIMRAGYRGDYFELGAMFEMLRPQS